MDKNGYGRIRRRPQRNSAADDKSTKATDQGELSLANNKSSKEPPPSGPTRRSQTPDRTPAPPSRRREQSRSESSSRPPGGTGSRGGRKYPSGGKPPSRRPTDRDRKRHAEVRIPRATTLPIKRLELKLESIALPALVVMAATAFFYYAAPILVPLVAAISFAYILSPLVDLIKKARVPHVVAVLLVMIVGAVSLAGAGYLIFQESVQLATAMPDYYESVKGWLIESMTGYQQFQRSSGTLLPELDESLLEGISFADFSGLGTYLFKGIGSVLSTVLGLTMIVLLTLFILLDQPTLRKRLPMVIGDDPRLSADILQGINHQIRGFLLVKFVTTVGLSIIFTVGLLILGVNYAYVWGPLAGVLNLVPYVGAFVGMVPPVIVSIIQTGGVTTALWVFLFYLVVQLVESNVITPKLVGNKVNLNLLAVLLSTVYWGWLWGMLGVLLAVPITGAIKVICSYIEPLRPIAILLGGESDITSAGAK